MSMDWNLAWVKPEGAPVRAFVTLCGQPQSASLNCDLNVYLSDDFVNSAMLTKLRSWLRLGITASSFLHKESRFSTRINITCTPQCWVFTKQHWAQLFWPPKGNKRSRRLSSLKAQLEANFSPCLTFSLLSLRLSSISVHPTTSHYCGVFDSRACNQSAQLEVTLQLSEVYVRSILTQLVCFTQALPNCTKMCRNQGVLIKRAYSHCSTQSKYKFEWMNKLTDMKHLTPNRFRWWMSKLCFNSDTMVSLEVGRCLALREKRSTGSPQSAC